MSFGLQTVADLAISTFQEYLNNPNKDYNQEFKFPHWNDIIRKIVEVWTNKYEGHLEVYKNPTEIDNLFQKFQNDITKILSKRADFQSLKSYYYHLIEYEIILIRKELLNVEFESKENDESNKPKRFNKTKSYNAENTNTNATNTTNTSNSIINRSNSNISKTLPKKLDSSKLFLNYELTHMLRCHSKQNDSNDNSTEVNDASFELSKLNESIDELPTYTDICATCGYNTINLIDVTTGKITQRFNDDHHINRSKEIFYKLNWTIINGTSVLAAGGKHGQIKLLIPKYSACIARIDAHNSRINSILFHYKYPNILLTASDDHQIKIWRINIKESNSSIECECSNELLAIVEYNMERSTNKKEAVLSMCFIRNDFLIISTELKNYSVCLSDEHLFPTNQKDMTDSDKNLSGQEMIKFLTSNPKENNNILQAKILITEARSESNSIPYEDNFIANKLLYVDNLLVANIVNTNVIYVLDCLFENISDDSGDFKSEKFDLVKLKVFAYVQKGQENNELYSTMNLHKDKEFNRFYLLQPSINGLFENIVLNSSLEKRIIAARYNIPTEYVIKNKKDLSKISVKDYNLLEKPKVISCVSNGSFILATTNQNLITIWKKLNIINSNNDN